MNIIILVSKLYPWVGGTETQTETIAKELHLRGHEVTVLTRQFPSKRLPENEDRGFVIRRFRYLNYPLVRYITQSFHFLNEIRKNRKRIDVLLCMQLTPNGIIGCVAKKFFGIPIVSYVRGGDWYFNQKGIGRVMISYVMKNSDLVIVQTEKIRRDVSEQFPEARMKVVPNGIYPHGKTAHGRDVIFVGNLIGRKGVEYLISAMEGLDEKLIIVGSGPQESELRKQAGKNVEFVGQIPNERLRDYMCERGRVVVLPSVSGEGLPNVILEAMSVGLPVVSTKIAGIPDVVRDRETGLLVEPRDVDGLREAILKLSKDETLRRKMSVNCLKDIKKYYWGNVTDRLEKSLSSALR